MPYITQTARGELEFSGRSPEITGELNYAITKLVLSYMEGQGLSYQTINDILGALEGAKLEFYRRVAVPYEDGKIQTNGDVYP